MEVNMTLQRINTFFRRVGQWQVNRRIWLLVAVVAITAVGFTGLTRFKSTAGEENWFDNSESIKRDTDRFQEIFGNDEDLVILVRAPDVFDPIVLDAINRLGNELLENVPYANRLTSLTNLEISLGTADGVEIVNPFGDGIPKDHDRIEAARQLILSRKTLKNRLVSDDCTETWVTLSLYAYPDETELNPNETEPMYAVGEAARHILEDPKWKNDTYEFLPAGTPYTESEELEVLQRETTLRVILSFVAMIACLVIFLRSLRGLIVPVFSTVAGIGVVFGFMGWFGITAEASLMSLPIVLGMALSVGYSIHLLNAINGHIRKTGNRRNSVIEAVSETGWPIFFTAITTIAGLISFLFANISPLRWLGLACSSVVLTVYAYTFTLVPVLMSFGKDNSPSSAQGEDTKGRHNEEGLTGGDRLAGKFGERLLRARWPILAFCIIAIVAVLPGIGKTTVNMDYFEMMGLKIPYIQRLDRIVNSQLGSYLDYNVVITFPEPDAAKSPENMRKLDEFMKTVGSYKMVKRIDGTIKCASVLDIVKEMNRALNSDDPTFYTIPDDQDMLTQLLFLYEISGGTGISQWVSEDYSQIRAQFDLVGYDANSIVSDIKSIKQLGAELFPTAHISVIGDAANYAEMNRKIVIGQLTSLAGAFVVICIMLIIAFGSVGTGFIAMIPNIAPVAIIGGLIGYLGWSLDMLTMTIMPMLLGIAVDDTIHFTNHIKLELERTGDYREAILGAFRSIGKTMVMTTIILCAAFVMYCTSPMNTLFKIGSLATIGLLTALIADYTLTPILIYILKPFGRKISPQSKTTEVA